MPRVLFDYKEMNLDPEKAELGLDVIEDINPHRFEFRLIDKILSVDKENNRAIGYVEIRDDQFWCRGHIPGRPIFPGVLQIEAAAQLSSVMGRHLGLIGRDKFFGLVGFDKIRYRKQVVPGDNIVILGQLKEHGRISTFEFQSLVNNKVVNQGEIMGTLF